MSASYITLRSLPPPNPLLVELLEQAQLSGGRALDVGAGPLGDTRLLLARGYKVDAVDPDPAFPAAAEKIDDARLCAVHTDIRRFCVPARTYDLIVSFHVLPFLPVPDLPVVARSLARGLRAGGVLCCTMFGPRDSWARYRRRSLTFLTEPEFLGLFGHLRAAYHGEREYDGRDATGRLKHWHVLAAVLVA